MLDPYKRLISIILYGISFLNYFKLIDVNNSKMSFITFFILNIILVSILVYLIIRKRSEINICQPNIFTIVFVIIADSIFIKSFIEDKYIDSDVLISFTFLILIGLNVSLFFELSD